jgi:hypothetical protein
MIERLLISQEEAGGDRVERNSRHEWVSRNGAVVGEIWTLD